MNFEIPTSKPYIGNAELKKIKNVLNSGWLGMGKETYEFENKLKEFLTAKNVIAVNTGTSALHLALSAINAGPGDEIIVPSLTFTATIQAIMQTQATPVFADICEETLNIDTNKIKQLITKKTKAIIPVHFSGLPCKMNDLLDIHKKNPKIRIIEDAAHAFGSYYNNKKIGSFGDITCFSFDPIKNITCGEGGAIVTADNNLTKIIKKKRILGINKDTWSRHKENQPWIYSVDCLGFRYHMSNINAAIGICQLERFNKIEKRKRNIVKYYDKHFKKINQITIPHRDYENTSYFNYVIKIKTKRNKLILFLKQKGIHASINYLSNHTQPFFKQFHRKLPITEKLEKQIITLPLYYGLKQKEIKYIIEQIYLFFDQEVKK
jgi:perosamine synthetase